MCSGLIWCMSQASCAPSGFWIGWTTTLTRSSFFRCSGSVSSISASRSTCEVDETSFACWRALYMMVGLSRLAFFRDQWEAAISGIRSIAQMDWPR